MDPQTRMTQTYLRVVKNFKSIAMLGELVTLLLRILSQRIFSVYIGIVLVQFIVTTQMNFKSYCVAESRFYIIMNFILMYLLTINFIENFDTESQAIQTIIKDKYIIDYTKIGYPLEFLFRIVSTFLMWRLYQFSKMKTFQYGDLLPNDEVETTERRHDRIHVRENERNQGVGHNSSRNDNENSRNLPNDQQNLSQSISNHPQIIRQRNSRVSIQHQNIINGNNVRALNNLPHRDSGISNNLYDTNLREQNRPQIGAEIILPQSLNMPVNGINIIQRPYTNVIYRNIHGQQIQAPNLQFRH